MSNSAENEELRFSPDFPARVLAQAAAIRRRFRARVFVAAGLAFLSIAAGAFWSIGRYTVREPPAGFVPDESALAFTDMSRQTDPLSYMFPDAQPLAQFSDEYAIATSGGAMQRQQLLFADQEPARAAADF